METIQDIKDEILNIGSMSNDANEFEEIYQFLSTTFCQTNSSQLDIIERIKYILMNTSRYSCITDSRYDDQMHQYVFGLSCGHVVFSFDKIPPNFCDECGNKIL